MRDEVETWFLSYLKTFSRLQVEEVVAHYQAPMVMILPGAVMAMNTADDVRNTFALVLSQYEASGYGETRVEDLQSRHLSEGLAEVGGTAVRYDSNGGELNRFAFRYVLRKESDDWKIAAMVNGDPVAPAAI